MRMVFWLSLIFILYVYAGYPILLFLWSKFKTNKVEKKEFTIAPAISILIAARNEENNVGKRLENLLSVDYPKERMEIIVVSDGSTDGTANTVRKYISISGGIHDVNVKKVKIILLEVRESRGKANALNEAYKLASGEFIVFADCRQEFRKDAIKKLLPNFNDPRIGCVSGELVFYSNRDSEIENEMGIYWNLEKRIRKMESDIGSVAGATGAIYVIRKHLYSTLPVGLILDDVYIPMKIVCAGYRTIFESQAIAYDKVSENYSREKARKVRTLSGNYQLLKAMPELLSPFRNPIFFRYLSHKVFRLFVPFFVAGLFVSSYLMKGLVYNLVFYAMTVLMLMPFFDKVLSRIPVLSTLSKVSNTFIALNYFAILAFFHQLKPQKKDIW